MKRRYFPFRIGAGLLVSGSIITGLANADMDNASHEHSKFMANKLDINNDDMINKTNLTAALLRCSRRWTAMVMAACMVKKPAR